MAILYFFLEIFASLFDGSLIEILASILAFAMATLALVHTVNFIVAAKRRFGIRWISRSAFTRLSDQFGPFRAVLILLEFLIVALLIFTPPPLLFIRILDFMPYWLHILAASGFALAAVNRAPKAEADA